MGLDELKKKKKPHQLVSKRKDGKRPGYYGPDEGFGDYDDSPSSSGGGSDNGGGYDYEYVAYNPPAPAPAPAPDTSGDDQEEDVARMMADMGLTPTTEEDDGGNELYVSPTLRMKQQEPYIDYKPGPNYVTARELSRFNRDIGDIDELSSTLSKIQAVNPIEKAGFFDSGIGKVLKTAGAIAVPILAPAFLPTSLAKGYTTYNQARNISRLANLATKGRTGTLPTLREAFTTFQGTGNKVPNVATGYESDGDNKLIPKNVIAANVQKFSPAQINNLQSNISLLESVLDSGQYRGTKLNSSQLSKVSNQRNSLLEQYNMIQEYLV